MNVIYSSGAAMLLAGAVTFSLFRFRTGGNTLDSVLRDLRTLTSSGRAALERVTAPKGRNPSEDVVSISGEDVYTCFWNSRQYLKIANCARLCEPNDAELRAMFETFHDDHRKIRWLLLLSIVERIVGKLGLGRVTAYARVLLWTYGEELELLDQISRKCGPTERTAIQAIL